MHGVPYAVPVAAWATKEHLFPALRKRAVIQPQNATADFLLFNTCMPAIATIQQYKNRKEIPQQQRYSKLSYLAPAAIAIAAGTLSSNDTWANALWNNTVKNSPALLYALGAMGQEWYNDNLVQRQQVPDVPQRQRAHAVQQITTPQPAPDNDYADLLADVIAKKEPELIVNPRLECVHAAINDLLSHQEGQEQIQSAINANQQYKERLYEHALQQIFESENSAHATSIEKRTQELLINKFNAMRTKALESQRLKGEIYEKETTEKLLLKLARKATELSRMIVKLMEMPLNERTPEVYNFAELYEDLSVMNVIVEHTTEKPHDLMAVFKLVYKSVLQDLVSRNFSEENFTIKLEQYIDGKLKQLAAFSPLFALDLYRFNNHASFEQKKQIFIKMISDFEDEPTSKLVDSELRQLHQNRKQQ